MLIRVISTVIISITLPAQWDTSMIVTTEISRRTASHLLWSVDRLTRKQHTLAFCLCKATVFAQVQYSEGFQKIWVFANWRNILGTKLHWNDLLQTHHSLVHHCCLYSHRSHCTLPTMVHNGSWFYSWTVCDCHIDKQVPLKEAVVQINCVT